MTFWAVERPTSSTSFTSTRMSSAGSPYKSEREASWRSLSNSQKRQHVIVVAYSPSYLTRVTGPDHRIYLNLPKNDILLVSAMFN